VRSTLRSSGYLDAIEAAGITQQSPRSRKSRIADQTRLERSLVVRSALDVARSRPRVTAITDADSGEGEEGDAGRRKALDEALVFAELSAAPATTIKSAARAAEAAVDPTLRAVEDEHAAQAAKLQFLVQEVQNLRERTQEAIAAEEAARAEAEAAQALRLEYSRSIHRLIEVHEKFVGSIVDQHSSPTPPPPPSPPRIEGEPAWWQRSTRSGGVGAGALTVALSRTSSASSSSFGRLRLQRGPPALLLPPSPRTATRLRHAIRDAPPPLSPLAAASPAAAAPPSVSSLGRKSSSSSMYRSAYHEALRKLQSTIARHGSATHRLE
jgi:hypothetical protein